MFKSIAQSWRNADTRKKLLFMLFILVIFRAGNAILVPFINYDLLSQTAALTSGVFGIFNLFSGGAWSMATVFALGVQPYINASIVIQLLTVAIPVLERLQKEDQETGRKRVKYITYAATGVIAVVQALGYYILMRRYSLLSNTGIPAAILICACLIAGAAFVTFLGEIGERKGIGSGISFILLAGILSRIPSGISTLITETRTWFAMKSVTVDSLVEQGLSEDSAISLLQSSGTAPWVTALLLLGVAALMVLVILVNDAEERIPIQYAKRQVGRKLYGGHNTHLPIRVALAGVLPIIFAQALLSVFSTCFTLFGIPSEDSLLYGLYNFSTNQTWLYIFIYFLLIIGMTYYQCSVSFDPVKVSNSLRTAGASIPGYRPGKPTTDLLRKVAHRVAFIGALYIAIVGILPMAVGKFVSLPVSIGGTSLIIVVGVILEFYKKLDSELSLYSYTELF